MNQVIVYSNPDGSVSICTPTGEVPIQEVLEKNCPPGSVIFYDSDLPQGANAQFVDAWELNVNVVVVNFDKAKAIRLSEYNGFAIQAARRRQANTLAGIPNFPDDATWMAALTNGRDAIAAATTTEELIAIPNPTSK